MARITDLPNELLSTIFSLVREATPNTLLSLALTCRGLHHLVSTVLYKHVVLSWKLNSQCSLAKFIKQTPQTGLVRSLRIEVQRGPLTAFNIGYQTAFTHVEPLCNILPTLEKLSTFCINLEGEIDHRCLLPCSVTSRILDALPESLINLELDTEGADGGWDKTLGQTLITDSHLCPSISRLIPRLECLRLRTSTMCPALFTLLEPTSDGQPVSQLRNAVIKLELPHRARPSPSTVCDCTKSNPVRPTRGSRELKPTALFDPLMRLQDHGAFPYLQRFLLLTAKENRYMRVRDVATRSITDYPLQQCSSLSFRSNQDSDEDRIPDECYMIRDHDGLDWFGSYTQIETAIEHEVEWRDPLPGSGSRCPRKINVAEGTHRLHSEGLWSLATIRKRVNRMVVDGHPTNMAQFNGIQRVGVWFPDKSRKNEPESDKRN